jgi:peptidoglycan/xylan/chitin deacetylase (PgdA/CDA1 family)
LPLRVYLLSFFIGLVGVALFSVLLVRCLRVLRTGSRFAKICYVSFLLLFVALAYSLCYILFPCFDLSGTVLCRGSHSGKVIALTFDDGPNEPYTSQILDILKQAKVPATFFLVGKNIERYPALVQRMIREGHTVGNHSLDHASLIFMNRREILNEIEGWEKAMQGIALPLPKLFRAPHGWKTPWLVSILKEKGYSLIGWSRGVWDSDLPGVEVLQQRLTQKISNGEIILLHDGCDSRAGVDRSQTVAVLPETIRFYRQQGFQFTTLPHLLASSPP